MLSSYNRSQWLYNSPSKREIKRHRNKKYIFQDLVFNQIPSLVLFVMTHLELGSGSTNASNQCINLNKDTPVRL